MEMCESFNKWNWELSANFSRKQFHEIVPSLQNIRNDDQPYSMRNALFITRQLPVLFFFQIILNMFFCFNFV